jgi:hypothetical protein
MTVAEFSLYQNTHIRLRLTNGLELTGVLIEDAENAGENKSPFQFILTQHLLKWKAAKARGDLQEQRSFQLDADPDVITWVKLLDEPVF